MAKKISAVLVLGLTLLGLTVLLADALVAQQKPDEIPDAPSATRPIPPPPPSPRPGADEDTLPEPPPADPGAGVTTGSKELPRTAPDSTDEKAAPPPPMPEIKTVPAGSVPKDSETGQDLYKIIVNPTLVLVPVTVKDNEGRLVGGLQPKDFSVLESGKPQKLTWFTSDPFALSAAVVFDTGMADVSAMTANGAPTPTCPAAAS